MCKKQATANVVNQVASQGGLLGKKSASPAAEQEKKSSGILRSKAEVAADEAAVNGQVSTTGPATASVVGVNVDQPPGVSVGGSASASTRVKQGRGGGVGAGTLGRRRAASIGLGL